MSKLKYLKAQLQVRDKMIGALLHEIVEAKIKLPGHLLTVLDVIYKEIHNQETITSYLNPEKNLRSEKQWK